MLKRLFNWLFPKYSNWIPLGSFSHGETDYIVFVRKNLNNGLMKFKTIRVNGKFTYSSVSSVLPADLIDVKKQWEIINETKKQKS